MYAREDVIYIKPGGTAGSVFTCPSRFAETGFFICISDEPKSKLAWALGDRLQSQNVPLGTSDDFLFQQTFSNNKL